MKRNEFWWMKNASYHASQCVIVIHMPYIFWLSMITVLDVVSQNRCLKMAFNSSILDCSNISTINITNEKEAAEILYSPVQHVLSGVLVPCMMAVSFLSNSAFILIVYRMPELCTITNAYLVNMAVADLVYIELHGTLYFVLHTKCHQ